MLGVSLHSMELEHQLPERSWHDSIYPDQEVAALSWQEQATMLPGPDMLAATVKNTFIHFDVRDYVDHRRCSSTPPRYHNFTKAQLQPRAAQHFGVGCHDASSHQEGAQIAEEELSKHPPSYSKKRKQRPTKKKRNQYHQLVKATTDEMASNPNGFNIELLEHGVPVSIRNNVRLLHKFMVRMEMIHERLKAQQEKIQLVVEQSLF